jgi:CMP-N,N'-diacetyllegionaminic acid synthase
MRTLGVILARGGSRGLPDKHLLSLRGRSVIEYTFDHARAADRLDLVVVSSDCPRILALAARRGFVTVERPAELATDDASVQDVLLHALDAVESTAEMPRLDAVATLYGNVPVRPDGIIDGAIALLEGTACDSVRSFCPVGKWHPAWMSRLDGDAAVANRPGSIHRRQDLEPLFLHDGAIVVSSRASMEAGRANRGDPHAFFGADRRAVRTAQTDTVEVDSRRDFLLADAILGDRIEAARSQRKAA